VAERALKTFEEVMSIEDPNQIERDAKGLSFPLKRYGR
jgi:hypothetical protein